MHSEPTSWNENDVLTWQKWVTIMCQSRGIPLPTNLEIETLVRHWNPQVTVDQGIADLISMRNS